MKVSKILFILCCLMVTVYISNTVWAVSTPNIEITILTGALGEEGKMFPPELTKLWEPINSDTSSIVYTPNIKLIRIDMPEEKEYPFPSTGSWVDGFIKPDPRVVLKKTHDQLENTKINSAFSSNQKLDTNQIQTRKEKYSKETQMAFTIDPTNKNRLPSINELLPVLKKQIESDISTGNNPLKYLVYYKVGGVEKIAEKSVDPAPVKTPDKKPVVAPVKTPDSPATCAIAPISTEKKPNWYAVIEIGSKGIKPIAVEVKKVQGKLTPTDFDDKFGTHDVTPREEVSMPRVVQAICEDINHFQSQYGKLPIYLVGSSSMANVPHRAKLVEEIEKNVHLPVEFITAHQEADYLARGIWVPPLPMYRRCESTVIDIGSGNIKGGYLENCDPKVEKAPKEKYVSFDVQDFGTVAFSTQTQKSVDSNAFSNFIDAAKDTRKQLESKLDEQTRTRPELSNGKKRFYLAGGAVWAMNTLLCLDCPQYAKRSATNDQQEYTVIKPTDIDEFYRYVTQEGDKVCDYSVENKYLRYSMDGKYNRPWEESRIEKQKTAIKKVCGVFKASRDLVSAAEILRAIKTKMEITENSHIFFMQNNLYTWSRQYLIDKQSKEQ
ncbi:MAG: hypothetical protein V2B20_25400 [Pseudomonadota bacterium]